MCKHILVVFLFISTFLNVSLTADKFDKNCCNCHHNPIQLKMIMSKYTQKYSSQNRIKEAMFSFLKNPKKEDSAMHLGFLSKFGIKEKSKLDDKELKESIRSYYIKYNFKKLIE